MIEDRIETLVIARAHTLRGPASTAELATALARYCPPDAMSAAWSSTLAGAVERLRGATIDAANHLVDADALAHRIGPHSAATWQQLADRVLPALALGVAPADSKSLQKLSSRDAWAAAIVGRARGIWLDGPPPSLAAVCDANAWTNLGLGGRPKRLPAEVRGLFLSRELGTAPAAPDRLLRQLAAKLLEVPRADARSLRDGLVRFWLAGRALAPRFADDVQAVARTMRDGVFGDRKVYISSVWDQLRRAPAWSAISLDDFKTRLLSAHRAGDLVLSRADLVAAMNPSMLAASETIADGATFHFIVRDLA
jgi:hypothetical protein